MISANVHEAKTKLSHLIARAEAGEEVVIARAGKPAVRLVPVEPQAKPETRREAWDRVRREWAERGETFWMAPEPEMREFEERLAAVMSGELDESEL